MPPFVSTIPGTSIGQLHYSRGPIFRRALEVLQEMAPLELAAPWDNVGLLLDTPAICNPQLSRTAPMALGNRGNRHNAIGIEAEMKSELTSLNSGTGSKEPTSKDIQAYSAKSSTIPNDDSFSMILPSPADIPKMDPRQYNDASGKAGENAEKGNTGAEKGGEKAASPVEKNTGAGRTSAAETTDSSSKKSGAPMNSSSEGASQGAPTFGSVISGTIGQPTANETNVSSSPNVSSSLDFNETQHQNDMMNCNPSEEPTGPSLRVMLCNDLTEIVAQEAILRRANFIITYHPTPFGKTNKVLRSTHTSRVMMSMIINGIAVYSPHTAFDCASEGVNDWLFRTMYPEMTVARDLGVNYHPIEPHKADPTKLGYGRYGQFPVGQEMLLEDLIKQIKARCGGLKTLRRADGFEHDENPVFEYNINWGRVEGQHSNQEDAENLETQKTGGFLGFFGLGGDTKETTSNSQDEKKEKKKDAVLTKAAKAEQYERERLLCKKIKTIACCAGSGGSCLKTYLSRYEKGEVPKLDLFLTGEMSHHDVLEAVQNGVTVLLTEHSNSERGFLKPMGERFESMLRTKMNTVGDTTPLEVMVSQCDADPLYMV